MRDVARNSRGPTTAREALLKELAVSLNRDYGALKSLLVAASSRSPDATPDATDARTELAFGATNTIVLRRSEWSGPSVYVELAAGKKSQMPSDLTHRSDMAPWDWVRSNKFDLSVTFGEKTWKVNAQGIRFVATRDGEKITAEGVVKALDDYERSNLEDTPAPLRRDEFGAVYAFTNAFPFVYRTRAGQIGLLTVRSAASPEEQVELSWKPVQGWKLQRPPSALVRNVSEDNSAANDAVAHTKLRHALEALAEAAEQFKVGRLPPSELQAAKDAVRILEAEMTGDAVAVARARLEAAERQLALATNRFEAGVMPASEYRKAKNAVELLEAELRSLTTQLNRSPNTAPLQFGPVIERQLATHLFASENRVLDFETGQVLKVPNENGLYVATNNLYVQNNPRAFLDWIVKARGDLFATEGTGINLHLDDGRLVRLTNVASLDQVSRADLAGAERSGIAQDASLNKTNDVGAVFAFRTREGTLGAFKVTRISDKPPSLALSYKLVSNSGKP
jgi:hypothetical protein